MPRGSARKRPEYRDVGIVLRSYKLGESDKILRILTREHGKRSAVAKGVRKTTSRFGARLEPLTHVQLLVHRGRNMDTVKQAEIIESFPGVREDLDLYVSASAMAELADSMTADEEPHPELFLLLEEALQLLDRYPERAPFTRAFFDFRAMAAAGFELRVGTCASCGKAPGAGGASFSLHMGGLVCEGCSSGGERGAGRLVTLQADTVELLAWMGVHRLGEWPSRPPRAGAAKEAGALMDRVLEHWMEREFKSHRVMKEFPQGRAREGTTDG
ncbi:MAG: DNA repair protein RecO [Actinobacteria bacterium]|nr:DNA repair protein RecO [Actinomycetota bacterium]MBU1943694.1 DNA repair protein RecO [Actinomycetota bacterium]MBU2686162.1 DNA repair protein RecO [Actinomycetota bacterium]